MATTWLLIGAIFIGIAIFLDIVFCPTECHSMPRRRY